MDRSSDDDEDKEKKRIDRRSISPWQARWAPRVKAILFCIHIVMAIAQFALIASSTTFSFNATIVSIERSGPVDSSGTAGVNVVAVSSVDAAAAFAAANFFAAFGYLFSLFFHAQEIEYVERGVTPFLWLTFIYSHVPLWLGIELASGIASWTELLALAGLISSFFCIYWIGAFTNSYAHIDWSHNRVFSWAFLVMALVPAVVVQICVYYSAAIKTQFGGPSIHLVIPITATLFSLLIPIVLLLTYFEYGIKNAFWSLAIIYIYDSLYVVLLSWLALTVFAVDSIVYP